VDSRLKTLLYHGQTNRACPQRHQSDGTPKGNGIDRRCIRGWEEHPFAYHGNVGPAHKRTGVFRGKNLFKSSEAVLAGFRNRFLGFVFQFHHLLPEFTALENTTLPALMQKIPKHQAVDAATKLLTEVGLAHRLHHKPGELSGGEQQRVAVARALIRNPVLVLADEPTGNLDTHTGDELFELLRRLNERHGTAFVIVTHNEKLSLQTDRLIQLQDGQITDDRRLRPCPPEVKDPTQEQQGGG
jgi:lipoprotein-releasing system ATP-binding protein